MQNTCINRKVSKGKAQEKEVRGKKFDQKKQKILLLLGIEPCTTCKYGPYTVIYGQKSQLRYRIYGVPRIRRIYGHTVWANPRHAAIADCKGACRYT